jgi:hypothetical protein
MLFFSLCLCFIYAIFFFVEYNMQILVYYYYHYEEDMLSLSYKIVMSMTRCLLNNLYFIENKTSIITAIRFLFFAMPHAGRLEYL